MSLRWTQRADFFNRGEEQFQILYERIFGTGIRVSVVCLFYQYFENEERNCLCEEQVLKPRIFESSSSAEMFISRLKKDYEIKIDGLYERRYYFGRQNSHYGKE